MAKNKFMETLDEHLNTVFYNTDQFGIEFIYYPSGGVTAITLQGIFDRSPSNNPIDSSDATYIDNRPTLRVRDVDFKTHSIEGRTFPNVNTDRVSIDGKMYEFDEYQLTETGETVCYLMEV